MPEKRASGSSNCFNNGQQNYCPDSSGDDASEKSPSDINTQYAEEPSTQEGTDDADDNIHDHSAAGSDHLAGDPTRDEAN